MHRENTPNWLRPYVAILLLFCFNYAAAQKIQGSVLDTEGTPVAGATVLLQKAADSSLVKGSVTDKSGTFSFHNIAPGTYLVSASSADYRAVHSSSFTYSHGEDKALGSLQFAQKEVQLSNVTVTARKPLYEQRMDRMVINVSSSVTGVGSTALDVLERSPGIIVDRQNSSLSMNGKDGIVVMINGRISRMPVAAVVQMLEGMNSSNIEKIELITTPPAQYEAEGNAGYINIVLKVNTQFGTNGSYAATAGYSRGAIASTSINFNHRAGRTNVFGDYSINRRSMEQNFRFYRKVMQGGTPLESHINTDRDAAFVFTNARLGLDYQLNKKTVVGTLVTGFYRHWTMDAFNNSDIFLDELLDTLVRINNDEVNNLKNFSANLNLLHNFREGEKLSMDADYIYYTNDNPNDYLNSYFNGTGTSLFSSQTRSGKETPIKFWVSNVDYSRKLGKKVNMDAGIKGSVSHFVNDVSVESLLQGTWVADKEFTARYNLEESILAGYTSFGIAFNEKNSAKLGLRYEYTNSQLNTALQKDIVDRQYGRFFPTAFFSHKLNDKNSVNLSYSRRITRPTFNDMAPFVLFVDPNTLFSGNPALQPTISDGVKADYLYKSFIVSVGYTYESDPITNFTPKVDPLTNKQTLMAENQRSRRSVNAMVSLPFTVTKWWNMQYNLMANGQELDAVYKGDRVLIKQKNFSVRSVQNFKLPKEFSLELSGFYRSAGLFSIYKTRAFGVMDIGAQKKFAKSRSSLRLAYDNVLNTLKFRSSVNLPDQNLVLRGRLQFTYPAVRLTYTHNFGNEKLKGNRQRNTSAEERERVQTN